MDRPSESAHFPMQVGGKSACSAYAGDGLTGLNLVSSDYSKIVQMKIYAEESQSVAEYEGIAIYQASGPMHHQTGGR